MSSKKQAEMDLYSSFYPTGAGQDVHSSPSTLAHKHGVGKGSMVADQTEYTSPSTTIKTNAYNNIIEKNVRSLLDANDRLREVLNGEPIRLPSIAVIGGQSSGKSSILERISGVNLPSGTGMVTRCGKFHVISNDDISFLTHFIDSVS